MFLRLYLFPLYLFPQPQFPARLWSSPGRWVPGLPSLPLLFPQSLLPSLPLMFLPPSFLPAALFFSYVQGR